MKNWYIKFLLGLTIIIFLLTLSPFNVYHWINAENIVKSSPHFQGYSGHVDNIESVKYLGRHSYLIKTAEAKQYIFIIKKVNGVTSSQIYEGDGLVRRELR